MVRASIVRRCGRAAAACVNAYRVSKGIDNGKRTTSDNAGFPASNTAANRSAVRIGIDQRPPAAAIERRPLAFALRQTIGHRIDDRGMMTHAAMATFDLDTL